MTVIKLKTQQKNIRITQQSPRVKLQRIEPKIVIKQVGSPGKDGEDGVGVRNGGTTGQILAKASDADFDTTWENAPSGGGLPGGSDKEVQFNDNGEFGGDSGLVYDKSTDSLKINGGTGAGVTLEVGGTADILYLSMEGSLAIDNDKNASLHNVNATGTVEGSNLSGTNTGDQDLSGIVQDKNYTQDFTVSSNVTVNHNLNKYPTVAVFDSANDEVIGAIEYTSLNALIVSFSAPFSGRVTCN